MGGRAVVFLPKKRMAATLETAPRPLSHSGNPHPVRLETNLGAPDKAAFTLTFSGTPTAGQTFIFEWEGQVVTLTAATSPNNSGLQLPTKPGGMSNADYAVLIVEYLRRNQALTDDFNMSIDAGGGGLTVRLEARETGAMVMSLTGTADANVYFDVVAGAATFAQPNLTGVVRVIDLADPDAEDELLSLQAPYDAATSQVTFDLRGAFDWLAPALPSTASIAPNSGSPLLTGLASGTVGHARIRYADRYGAGTPAAESMLPSDPFWVIYGGLSADTTGDFPYSEALFWLHNYRLRGSIDPFWKPVAKGQPDWLYFFANEETGYTINVHLYWSDGTETNYVPSSSGLTIAAKTVKWVQAGYTQLKLGGITPATTGIEIVRYKVQIISGDHAIAEAGFEPDCAEHPWNISLMMDNGLGGMETVWLKGKAAWKYSVERDQYLRAPNAASEAELDTFLASGSHIIEVSTGWHERFYIEHLRQLLFAKLWIVDKANSRFIPVVMDTKTFDVGEDDQDLFALTFSLKYAISETAFNNF